MSLTPYGTAVPSGNQSAIEHEVAAYIASQQASGDANLSTFINFKPANFPHLRAAYANMRVGTSDPLIMCVGDSTTAGYSGTTYAGQKPNAWPARMGTLLTKYGIPASEECGNMALQRPSSFVGYSWDSRFTHTAWNTTLSSSTGLNSNSTPAGGYFLSSTSTQILGFTPTRQIDSFDVFYLDANAGASFTTNVDGGATINTVTTGSTLSWILKNNACTLGTHECQVVQANATQNEVMCIIPHTSTARQFNIMNCGWGGATAAAYPSATSPAYLSGSQQPWSVLAPCLVIIEFTINDGTGAINGGVATSVASYTSSIQSLITLAQGAGADVILCDGNPVSSATAIAAVPGYSAALQSLALANNCGYIAMNARRWVSYAVTNAIMPYGDSLHPGLAGYMDKAECYAQAIRAALGQGNILT